MTERNPNATPPTPLGPVHRRTMPVAGWLMAGGTAAALACALGAPLPAALAPSCLWLAAVLLAPVAPARSRLQAGALLLLGVAALLFAGADRGAWAKAARMHELLMAMLIAVSFLRLALRERPEPGPPPRGRGAVIGTLLGTHLLAAVINLSAVVLVAEHLARRRPRGDGPRLDELQALALSRAFANVAAWSPFFASVAVAVTYAPGARFAALVAHGLPLAAAGLALAALDLVRRPEAAGFEGFPLQREALRLPLLLASGVFAAHWLLPDAPVLALVGLLSAGTALASRGRQRQGRAAVHHHVTAALPRMGGELVLILAAGVFSAGVGEAVQALSLPAPFTALGGWQATATVAASMLGCVLGLHPLVAIAVAAGVLAPLEPPPDLLALVLLTSWVLGIGLSPVAMVHLTLQGRFGVPALSLVRANIGYALAQLAVAAAWLGWVAARLAGG